MLGVCEILLKEDAEANVYSLHNKELCEELVIYARADDEEARLAGTRALAAYHALECRDAARIDFRSNASGEPYFLEANPLAGLHPHHSDLPILAAQNGVPYVELIGMILDAGLARYGLARGQARSRRGDAPDGAEARRLHPRRACRDERPSRRDRHADQPPKPWLRALAELGFATEVVAVDLDLNHFQALKRRDPLLVFNLVDAVRGDGRLAPVIPSLLDAVGLPYTGAHSDAWLETLSKVATKLKLEQCRPADARLLGGRRTASILMHASSSRRCGSMARSGSTRARW